jgi:hypothetical protein
MKALTMKASIDFSHAYRIVICIGDNTKLNEVCQCLNNFCKELPNGIHTVELYKYLKQQRYQELLSSKLAECGIFTTDAVGIFIEKIIDICKKHDVYPQKDTFSIADVMQF